MECYNKKCTFYNWKIGNKCDIFSNVEMVEFCKKFKKARFSINDKVWHPGIGNGIVKNIIQECDDNYNDFTKDYPVSVYFHSYESVEHFTVNGKFDIEDINKTLYKGHNLKFSVEEND